MRMNVLVIISAGHRLFHCNSLVTVLVTSSLNV